MDKSSNSKNTAAAPSNDVTCQPPSSQYAASVRMTAERLANAVIKTTQQGGSIGVRDE
ncbi:hypothetical protein LIS44_01005 [Acinetobacter haemolyticus]|nr:hypothetical protein LIS44_01005 [Acinetobacter haemolyticus]